MTLMPFLTAFLFWCLFYGVFSPWILAGISLAAGVSLWLLGRHKHERIFAMHVLVQSSGLRTVNPGLKTWGCLALLLVDVSFGTTVGLMLTVTLLLLQIFAGRMRLRTYLSQVALPANFLMLSALALLFSWSSEPSGVLNIFLFGGWLNVTTAAQAHVIEVLSRALGALSCLFLLSLSTPIAEIIGVLQRAHVPAVVTDLMYLIYRYIYLLIETHARMRDAAESRLGYQHFSSSVRTAGMLYAGLLIRSFQRARTGFDAMESRCMQEGIRFLEEKKPLRIRDTIIFVIIFAAAVFVGVWGDLS